MVRGMQWTTTILLLVCHLSTICDPGEPVACRWLATPLQEVMGTGVRWAFTPAVSVCQDPRWGRCYESFSSNTRIVTPMSRNEVLGFQVSHKPSHKPS